MCAAWGRPDIFEARYNSTAGVLATITTIIACLTIVSYQFNGGGRILSIITVEAGIVITTAFATTYTVLAAVTVSVLALIVVSLLTPAPKREKREPFFQH